MIFVEAHFGHSSNLIEGYYEPTLHCNLCVQVNAVKLIAHVQLQTVGYFEINNKSVSNLLGINIHAAIARLLELCEILHKLKYLFRKKPS